MGRRKEKSLATRARPKPRIELKQSFPKLPIVTSRNGMCNRIGTENGRNQQGKMLIVEIFDPDHTS